MSQKKCPKCGEMNPPEAVMCWACYTPLTGGAAAAPGSPPPSSPVVSGSGDGLKKAVTPAQMAVLGVGFLVLAGFGIKTFMAPAGGGDDDEKVTVPPTPAADATAPAATAPTGAPPVPVNAPAAPAGLAVPAPQRQAFSIVTAPNAQYTWGTMAILLSNPNASSKEAAAAAAFVRQKMLRNKKWVILHIYVFTDKDAAMKFKAYQARRRGAPLGPADYTALGDIWQRTPVRYEYNRGSQGILLPSSTTGSWWTGKVAYTKVTS